MTHPTRAFSGSIINRFTGSKILARVGQISVAFPGATRLGIYGELHKTGDSKTEQASRTIATFYPPQL